jgi:hypothetical protein
VNLNEVVREVAERHSPLPKVKHHLDLIASDVEVLQNLLDRGCFQILKNRRHANPRTAEHPSAADLTSNALHRGALRPIETSRDLHSFLSEYADAPAKGPSDSHPFSSDSSEPKPLTSRSQPENIYLMNLFSYLRDPSTPAPKTAATVKPENPCH